MSQEDEMRLKSRRTELEENLYSYELEPEDLPVYHESDELIVALQQKEEDVILAAQLGKALLLENSQLKEERSQLHQQYADRIEALEQDRHMLHMKLRGSQVQWESQEAELERDVRELSAHVQVLTKALAQAQREKSHMEQQHGQLNQHLRQKLNTATEMEQVVTTDLQRLRQELRDTGYSGPQNVGLLGALKEQVERLTQQEQDLKQSLAVVCEENAALRDSLSSLQTRLARQEQQNSAQTQLVTQEVSSILDMLLPVSHGSDAPHNQNNTLQSMLGHLRSIAERIVHNQTVQNAQIMEENTERHLKVTSRLDEEIVQRAIKDRDDAIAKKTAMEAELVRTKSDMMCLNNQLLEAVQHKLQLSQELEAWQEDVQIIINQQLKNQHQTEQQQSERTRSGRLSLLHKTKRASPTCTPKPSPSSVQSPWRVWLKLGK
ncbi:BICD family-like cargo adapter 1 isoform X2 [Brachyhypopomus gauderio]|uniref:BICD family-like cargo adapter 1 isoform X2 n=1 Tax=Brachyhypopomus gauderio TaxID=698409 RepID=UPI004042C94A